MAELELRTEDVIDASPAVVWNVLSDFRRYGRWNPMVVAAEGVAEVGASVSLSYRSNIGARLSFRVRITRSDEGRELRWIGRRLGVSGEHYFELHPVEGGTRLVHGEVFRGPLVRPAAFAFRRQQPVFESFNAALKRVAEERAGRAPGSP